MSWEEIVKFIMTRMVTGDWMIVVEIWWNISLYLLQSTDKSHLKERRSASKASPIQFNATGH